MLQILLPFWIGVLNILTFLTGLDPIWVLVFNKRYVFDTYENKKTVTRVFNHFVIIIILVKQPHLNSIQLNNHKQNVF